ncbi:DUF4350 domain-containing protein [Nonomuraea sp. NEAU-A123]|uniref:DUF4350 domain-containing protein n=1 Tax=Nonomuraea sp. NEAU-A123 TaxID=2839649 RepID=UPI001BE46A0A|nr:DUF4350 domain-containing protein [Nonomuraea sp. NEAU-A123]MBT2224641.1 DUF4350 domain-containing protein [Nonomuraea sp. NEAU-A123]
MSLDMRPRETGESRSTSPTVRSTWRASRLIVLLGALIVLAAVFSVLLKPDTRPPRHLDPADASLAGSMALAELLRDRGVTVDRVDSAEAAVAKATGAAPGDRLLLITDASYVDPRALAGIQGDRVIADNLFTLDELAPAVRPVRGAARERSREPDCSLPAAKAAGSAFIGDSAFTGPAGSTGCYPWSDGWTLVSYPNAGGTTTVLGSAEFMTNQRLSEDGNAALALNLLGSAKAVTWLVAPETPPVGELPGEAGQSMYDLMPASIPWAVLMTVITVLLVAFWRGRRLGPVVIERLPVVVRAAETVEGRGRLYRARRARGRAADSLRAGTIDRLTPRLGLGSGSGRHELVAAVAVRTGQDAQEVGAALYGPAPADDAGLVALAGYLDFIERTVSEH